MLSLRRVILMSLVVVVMVATMAAATVTAQPSASASATVTVKFAASVQTQAPWKAMIASFERAYPDIRVEARFLPGDYGAVLQTQLHANNIPDVFLTYPGNGYTASVIPLAKAGYLMDLAGQPWVNRLQPAAKPLVTRNKYKNVYAWPMDVQVGALWINQPAFKQLGLKAPKDFSDLLTLCKTIAKTGKTPVAAFGIPPNTAASIGTVMAARTGATSAHFEYLRKLGKVKFATSKPWQRALTSITDMKKAGCFSPGAPGMTLFAAAGQLASGQALMFAGPSQILSVVNPLIKDRSQVSFAGVAMPGDEAGKSFVQITPFDSVSIWRNTKVKDAAQTFVKFLAAAPQVTFFARLTGNVNSLNATKGKLPDFMKAIEPYFKGGKLQLSPGVVWPNPAVYGAFGTSFVGLLTGQKTIAQVLSDTDAVYDRK